MRLTHIVLVNGTAQSYAVESCPPVQKMKRKRVPETPRPVKKKSAARKAHFNSDDTDVTGVAGDIDERAFRGEKRKSVSRGRRQ